METVIRNAEQAFANLSDCLKSLGGSIRGNGLDKIELIKQVASLNAEKERLQENLEHELNISNRLGEKVAMARGERDYWEAMYRQPISGIVWRRIKKFFWR